MSKCNRLGTTVIDALTLCYVAEGALLEDLRSIESVREYGKFIFHRTKGKIFAQQFNVLNEGRKIARFYFDNYSSEKFAPYVWIRMENHILYNRQMLLDTLLLATLFDLSFNNFTDIDLARDFTFDITQIVRSLMRNANVQTIINGKEIKDRKEVINNIYRTCGMSLERDGRKGITIKQRKAEKNKNQGITIAGYNKYEEIKSGYDNNRCLPITTNNCCAGKIHKDFILDFYGNPKTLHRWEVRLHNETIKRICNLTKIPYELNIIFNQDILDTIYIAALERVLRFRKRKKKIEWEDIFLRSGRVR